MQMTGFALSTIIYLLPTGAAAADERTAAGLECAAALLCTLLRKRPALATTVGKTVFNYGSCCSLCCCMCCCGVLHMLKTLASFNNHSRQDKWYPLQKPLVSQLCFTKQEDVLSHCSVTNLAHCLLV